MARSGWSASNYLLTSAAPVTAVPLTISAWANTSVLATTQTIAGVCASGSVGALNQFRLGVDSTNHVAFMCDDGGTSISTPTSTTISASTWFHGCAVASGVAARAVYLNGGGKATDTNSRTPTGINRAGIGIRASSSLDTPFAPAGTGLIAEVAIWNIALSDADVLALSKGLPAVLMHPEALVAYWPLTGNNSPENNLKSNSVTMAITGALSKAAHPRIFMPHRRQISA